MSTDEPRTHVYRPAPRLKRQPFFNARTGGLDLISLPSVAHRDQTALVIRALEGELYRRNVVEKLCNRITLCASEALGNAMRHGIPRSHVGCNVVIYGHQPEQVFVLMVENLLPLGFDPPIPSEEEVPSLEDIIMSDHGRGLAIMRDQASAFSIIVNPGLSVLATMLFLPQR